MLPFPILLYSSCRLLFGPIPPSNCVYNLFTQSNKSSSIHSFHVLFSFPLYFHHSLSLSSSLLSSHPTFNQFHTLHPIGIFSSYHVSFGSWSSLSFTCFSRHSPHKACYSRYGHEKAYRSENATSFGISGTAVLEAFLDLLFYVLWNQASTHTQGHIFNSPCFVRRLLIDSRHGKVELSRESGHASSRFQNGISLPLTSL